MREAVTGGWRKMHSEQLHYLQSPPTVTQVIKRKTVRQARHVACIGNKTSAFRVMGETPEGNRPLGRVRRRWKTNIKLDLKGKRGRRGRDSSGSGWGLTWAIVITVMNLQVL